MINAIPAFEAGATGQGIVVAVVDTGIDVDSRELAGRIDPRSTDIVSDRGVNDEEGHGTFVAGIIAANRNNVGSHGVAFESTILAIRAETVDSCTSEEECSFSSVNLARAVDFAVASGARVINLSLGGEGALSPFLRSALVRAVNAGVLIVAAAGNDSGPNPLQPSSFANDPAAMGRAVAVGAVDSDSNLSSFSNMAGIAQNNFLVAPGTRVFTTGTDDRFFLVSGTSFAAPHVSGALALLLDAFPQLAPEEALEILFLSAADLGIAGVDNVFGRGLLDIGRAFQPIGTATLAARSVSGAPTAIPLPAPSGPIGAAGDWIAASAALDAAIITDAFDRPFRVDLGAALAAQAPAGSSLTAVLAGQLAREPVVQRVASGPGFVASFTDRDRSFDDVLPFSALRDDSPRLEVEAAFGPWRLSAVSGGAPIGAEAGRGLSSAWRSSFVQGFGESGSFTEIGRRFGALEVGFNAGLGQEVGLFGAYAARAFGAHALRLDVSRVQEQGATALGAFASAFGGAQERAQSLSTALSWRGPIAFGAFGAVRTEIAQSQIAPFTAIAETAQTWSLAWAASLERRFGGVALRAGIAQPLRIESGGFAVDLASSVAADGSLVFSRQFLGLSPTGRELDVELGMGLDLPFGRLSANVIHVVDDAHVAGRNSTGGLLRLHGTF